MPNMMIQNPDVIRSSVCRLIFSILVSAVTMSASLGSASSKRTYFSWASRSSTLTATVSWATVTEGWASVAAGSSDTRNRSVSKSEGMLHPEPSTRGSCYFLPRELPWRGSHDPCWPALQVVFRAALDTVKRKCPWTGHLKTAGAERTSHGCCSLRSIIFDSTNYLIIFIPSFCFLTSNPCTTIDNINQSSKNPIDFLFAFFYRTAFGLISDDPLWGPRIISGKLYV
jgi:hypothetical protein